jgi:hypothetical protein
VKAQGAVAHVCNPSFSEDRRITFPGQARQSYEKPSHEFNPRSHKERERGRERLKTLNDLQSPFMSKPPFVLF